MKKILFISLLGFLFITSCKKETTEVTNDYQGKAKYVFFFIGDGMGLGHVALTEGYLSAIEDTIGFKNLTMSEFPTMGFATTYAANRFITCSAAAGTALATGYKTSIGTIGMNADHSDSLYSIAYYAKQQGFKVGVLTSVSINHATPAAFYAHQPSRSNYYEIAMQLANSNYDVFGGGGINKHLGSDGANTDAYEVVKNAGYFITRTNEDFELLNNSNGKVLMVSPDILSDASLWYSIDQTENMLNTADFTEKAIELLDNPDGFFLMVEGGKIDWAAHSNDAAAVVKEVIDFDNAIQKAVDFYNQHPDETIIIITADHETGGLGLGWDAMHYESNLKLLQNQKGSIDRFNDTLAGLINQVSFQNLTFEQVFDLGEYFFGLNEDNLSQDEILYLKNAFNEFKANDEVIENLYSESNTIADAYNKLISHKAGIGWTTHSHTANPVPVRALGIGQQLFEGYYDNTDIPKKIAELMGLKVF